MTKVALMMLAVPTMCSCTTSALIPTGDLTFVRAVDGAVQIWETLLERYPRSPLRPLTLYRLGWAYHSVAASGFPRDSGDQAFDELARSGAPPSVAALLPAARVV